VTHINWLWGPQSPIFFLFWWASLVGPSQGSFNQSFGQSQQQFSSLPMFGGCWWTKIVELKTCSFATDGLWLVKRSLGVLSGWDLVECKFKMIVVAWIVSPHKYYNKFLSMRKQHVISNNDWVHHSTMLFCWGVYDTINCCLIPLLSQ